MIGIFQPVLLSIELHLMMELTKLLETMQRVTTMDRNRNQIRMIQEKEDQKAYILIMLNSYPQPVKVQTFSKRFTMHPEEVREALEELVREGKATTNGLAGQYKRYCRLPTQD